jgi:hypothetical protein
MKSLTLFLTLAALVSPSPGADQGRKTLTARASELDPRAKPHPEIDFIFEKDGKAQDIQNASVNLDVKMQGKLVVWLMGHSDGLFERLNSYGLHAIQVHYANKWFGKLIPTDRMARGNVRLEAAIGRDVSDQIDIPQPDSMMERSFQFVKWLAKEHPGGKWDQFLTQNGKGLQWEKVIISGSSHGSTTAARFAKEVKVDRVVMLCGPRDQDQNWQALPSATPANRYFGFSHVLDGGWSGDHYCRSWELLGLHQFGPIVTVDDSEPPYVNTRRLISNADVGGNADKAHGAVTPGKNSPKAADGKLAYEPVWKYLYTHPVELTGEPGAIDQNCQKDHPLGK